MQIGVMLDKLKDVCVDGLSGSEDLTQKTCGASFQGSGGLSVDLAPVSRGKLDVAGQNCKHRPRAECSWPTRRPCGPGWVGFIEIGQGLG